METRAVLLLLLSHGGALAEDPPRAVVPTRRFGRTEIAMPVFTLGGMRQQQTWKPKPGMSMDDIDPECQANFVAIIERALELGINHFETARGYGCSEMQYGAALRELLSRPTSSGRMYKREDLIIQSKVAPFATQEEFRETLDKTLDTLGIGYLDLFSFHGINQERHLNWTLRDGGCMEVAREYQRLGKIKWIGFSTHGMGGLVRKTIDSRWGSAPAFDYVNLHYHFIGSYTTTGSGPTGSNDGALIAAREHDMGVFIISPNDKGGMLYKPSKILAEATAPLSPIAFNNLWLLQLQPRRRGAQVEHLVHTMVIGAARPSDFDEHMASLVHLPQAHRMLLDIQQKLTGLMATALTGSALRLERGADAWWRGIPDVYGNIDGHGSLEGDGESLNPDATNFLMNIWCWRLIKGYGLLEYCREKIHGNLATNRAKWNSTEGASYRENVLSMNHWGPGTSLASVRAGEGGEAVAASWGAALRQVPMLRKAETIMALNEVRAWMAPPLPTPSDDAKRQQLLSKIPEGAVPAMDMQPDVPWPERTPMQAGPDSRKVLGFRDVDVAAGCVAMGIGLALLCQWGGGKPGPIPERSGELAAGTIDAAGTPKKGKQQRERSASPASGSTRGRGGKGSPSPVRKRR